MPGSGEGESKGEGREGVKGKGGEEENKVEAV